MDDWEEGKEEVIPPDFSYCSYLLLLLSDPVYYSLFWRALIFLFVECFIQLIETFLPAFFLLRGVY